MTTTTPSIVPRSNHQLCNQDSGNSEWFTPPHIIEAAREVMGSIDLDPASCRAANEIVKAKTYYSLENGDNGLELPWFGNVWLNHPFSRQGNYDWIERLIRSYTNLSFNQSCNICYAATSEEWFRPLLSRPQCFLRGRTAYIDSRTMKPQRDVPKGSVVTYHGTNLSAFVAVFSKLGTVKVAY
jgi:ParB family chromosome partitioning protein